MCACIAATLAVTVPTVAWRQERRRRWAVLAGAAVVLSALLLFAVATSEVQ
jgi:hypothetical protein